MSPTEDKMNDPFEKAPSTDSQDSKPPCNEVTSNDTTGDESRDTMHPGVNETRSDSHRTTPLITEAMYKSYALLEYGVQQSYKERTECLYGISPLTSTVTAQVCDQLKTYQFVHNQLMSVHDITDQDADLPPFPGIITARTMRSLKPIPRRLKGRCSRIWEGHWLVPLRNLQRQLVSCPENAKNE